MRNLPINYLKTEEKRKREDKTEMDKRRAREKERGERERRRRRVYHLFDRSRTLIAVSQF